MLTLKKLSNTCNFLVSICSLFLFPYHHAQRQHENALRELKILQQSRSELEKHVDTLVLEREMLKKQLSAAKQARPEEIKVHFLVYS